jgi:hypothetical protein
MLAPGLNRWGQILLHFGTMGLLETATRIHDLAVQKASKIRIILIHITDARQRLYRFRRPGFCGSLPGQG